jgi:hypothetical protein
MIPAREALLEKAAGVPAPPVAVEAFWDGDTTGWFVVLTILYTEPSVSEPRCREYTLAAMRGEGGDLRLFNGHVPPWPEAVRAREVGEELSRRLGVPFFFASPDHPEEACSRWWDCEQGYPCRRCGILLLQQEDCPWRSVCYNCHLAEKREGKSG